MTDVIGSTLCFDTYASMKCNAAPTAATGAAGTQKYASAVNPMVYRVSFANGSGQEGELGPASNQITTDNVIVNLTNVPIGPTGTTARKIYRGYAGTLSGNYIGMIIGNVGTTFTDDVSFATASANEPWPIGSRSSGMFYIDSKSTLALQLDQLGNLGIGTRTPGGSFNGGGAYLAIEKTMAEAYPSTLLANCSKYGRRTTLGIAPSGDSAKGSYIGDSLAMSVESSNDNDIYTLTGGSTGITNKSSGYILALYGENGTVNNYGLINSAKGGWFSGANYGEIEDFLYGMQANADNYGSVDGIGSIYVARAARFRLQNTAVANMAGSQGPVIVNADLIYANFASTGKAGVSSEVTNLTGFMYDMANGANHYIQNSYGIKLNSPTNSGTIDRHTGILIQDQTLTGVDSHSLKIEGGKTQIQGQIGFFGATPVARQTGAAATAGGTYGATEQAMLQAAYNALRAFGLMG